MTSRLNHVSVSVPNLGVSLRFYESVFGLERVPTPNFGFPVQWLRAGRGQLHLLERGDGPPGAQHFALTVDDFEGVYSRAERWNCFDNEVFGNHLIILPDGTAQLYLRDPGMNLVEVDFFSADDLPSAFRQQARWLKDLFPQSIENLQSRLLIDDEAD